MADTIKVVTVNCQGLSTPSKRKDVLNFYKSKKYSIICFQDTHFIPDLEPYIESQWGYKCIFNSYCSNSRGVAIFFNNDFELKLYKEKKDANGNLLALDLSIDENRLTLLNIYGPNNDSPIFFENIRDVLLEFDNPYFMVCGDFNITLNPDLDSYNYYHVNNPNAREKLMEIMNDLNLVDYFRILNPDKRVYTWHKKNPFKQGRLDYILISENLSNIVEKFSIKAGYRSDHSIVVLELKFNSFERGRGLWKFNNSLLSDKVYVKKVKETIYKTKNQYLRNNDDQAVDNTNEYIIDHGLLLETLLLEIRGVTISYSAYKKRERDRLEDILVKEIEELEQNNQMGNNSNTIDEKRTDLESLRREKLQGIMVRSKAQWVEEGEKPTRYFCNLESRNYLNKTIKKIEVDGKGTIYEQKDILKEVQSFYQNLYKSKEDEICDINLAHLFENSDIHIPKLDRQISNDLEREITEAELLSTLKNMKNNKSPGSDGYTAEFFKFFWKDLSTIIVRAVNDAFFKKQLPISQRLGIISCLPKGDKPRQHLKNWRPITLLNVFYKLISGCLSQRIKSTLDQLISSSQTGFLSGRYIGENTRLLYDIMSYTECNDIPGLLVLIDFEKAFDSIAWSFVYKVLNFFGFGQNLITWIKILNTDIKASIVQSGFLSEQISIQRGCRQGDPVAPYIFLLCAEILSLLVKQNTDIKGIVINKVEHKISQYADDTSFIRDGSKKSLFAALETLQYFSQLSGLKINTSKTKVIWIGSKKFSDQVHHHVRWKLEWGCTTFTLLGINFSVDLENIVELNFNIQIPKVEALLKQWNRRILTPLGRVTVIKTLVAPKLNHLFLPLPNPKKEIIVELTKAFSNFLWGSKCSKIKKDTVTQPTEEGGLNMINLEAFISSLKCTWIRRLLTGGQSWINIFVANFGKDFHLQRVWLASRERLPFRTPGSVPHFGTC